MLLAVVCVSARAAAEEVRPPEFVGLRVGLADQYKVGVWTPVELTLRGGSEELLGQVRLTVPDDDATPSRFTAPAGPLRLRPDEEITVRLAVRFGRVQSTATAEFVVDQGAGHQGAGTKEPGASGSPRGGCSPPQPQPAAITI